MMKIMKFMAKTISAMLLVLALVLRSQSPAFVSVRLNDHTPASNFGM